MTTYCAELSVEEFLMKYNINQCYATKYAAALKKIGIDSQNDFEIIRCENDFDKLMNAIKDTIKDRVADLLKLKLAWKESQQVILHLVFFAIYIYYTINHFLRNEKQCRWI